MSAVTYLQINIIPMIALIIMRVNTRQTLSYSWRNRALRFIMVLLVVVMAMNTAAWMLNGQRFAGTKILLWLCNMLYFGVLDFMAFLWALYVRDIVANGEGQRGRGVYVPGIPLAVFLVLLVTSPFTHFIFYIDEQNQYVRGSLFLIHTAVSVGYLAGASLYALWHCNKADTQERQRECRYLVYFAILPIVSGGIQVCFHGLDLLLPLTAASIAMVYVNVQKGQVTRDGLTGLNNRRRLEQHIKELEKRNCDYMSCYIIMMDVDSFKRINDTYGHVIGDEVLKMVADQMKHVFGDSKSFLARYGGDEFVIILRDKTKEEVEAQITELKSAVANMNWGPGRPWEIAISVGWAEYGEADVWSLKTLAAIADERMYAQKRANK